ncbi:MAG TPA: hypothetical protein VLN90_07080 [Thioalkalivibrio sp.]|nr:hypothetical protein [Thioalkalivibrio sp.]
MTHDIPDEQGPDPSRKAERLAWAGFMVFLVVVLFIYMLRGAGLEKDVAAANEENLRLQMHLSRYLDREVQVSADVGLSNAQVRRLQRLGLSNPVEQLREDLLAQPELIPHEPVLGGAMHFLSDSIQVLNDRWVLAIFEDGHIRGQMLLQYEVAYGNVTWQVMDSYLE